MKTAIVRLAWLWCGLVTGLAAAESDGALSPAMIKQIDAVFAPWDNTRSPGCALAVSRGGRVIFTRGYGMANLEHDVPITPDSIFHVASISKQFTTACVGLLAAEGKLAWQDDIRRYVPELPDYGHTITLAHLAHHTSGLRDQWTLLNLAGWREDDLVTERDVLQLAARQRALNFRPGEEFLYCNTGYTLLAVVVKRVSGQSLREFADARIFRPLGMTATHFHSDHTEIVRGRTSAYEPRPGGGLKISIPVFDTYGATSLFTTVGDLMKWEHNLMDGRVGGRAWVDSLSESGRLNDGRSTGYGLGLNRVSPRGAVEITHSGADAGYRTDVVLYPEHNLAVAVFCNLSSMRPNLLTRQVAEIVLGPGVLAPLPPPIVRSEAELKQLAGTYWNEATDEVRRLVYRDGKLLALGTVDALVPTGAGAFRVGETTARILLPEVAPGSGRELHVVSPTLGAAKFRQVEEPVLKADALAEFAGSFSSAELGATFRVVVAGDGLEWRSARGEPVRLRPARRDAFTGTGLGTITFVRGSDGAITGLTISTGRIRRLALSKDAST